VSPPASAPVAFAILGSRRRISCYIQQIILDVVIIAAIFLDRCDGGG
jgi:hypothetical protein